MTKLLPNVREFLQDESGRVGNPLDADRNDTNFDFNKHLSASLQWRWHIQDFSINSAVKTGPEALRVSFEPRYAPMFRVSQWFTGRRPVVAALTSYRLSAVATVITAGFVLGKDKKDGEVIARDFYLKCKQPLIYGPDDLIPVETHVRILKRTPRYALMISAFTIGAKAEHSGKSEFLYCAPNLKGYSYL